MLRQLRAFEFISHNFRLRLQRAGFVAAFCCCPSGLAFMVQYFGQGQVEHQNSSLEVANLLGPFANSAIFVMSIGFLELVLTDTVGPSPRPLRSRSIMSCSKNSWFPAKMGATGVWAKHDSGSELYMGVACAGMAGAWASSASKVYEDH